MSKCNLIYASKKCMAFVASIFTKLRMFNSIMCRPLILNFNHIGKHARKFMNLSRAWLPVLLFSKNSQLLNCIMWRSYIPNFTQTGQQPENTTINSFYL